jgi:hypothetical protein
VFHGKEVKAMSNQSNGRGRARQGQSAGTKEILRYTEWEDIVAALGATGVARVLEHYAGDRIVRREADHYKLRALDAETRPEHACVYLATGVYSDVRWAKGEALSFGHFLNRLLEGQDWRRYKAYCREVAGLPERMPKRVPVGGACGANTAKKGSGITQRERVPERPAPPPSPLPPRPRFRWPESARPTNCTLAGMLARSRRGLTTDAVMAAGPWEGKFLVGKRERFVTAFPVFRPGEPEPCGAICYPCGGGVFWKDGPRVMVADGSQDGLVAVYPGLVLPKFRRFNSGRPRDCWIHNSWSNWNEALAASRVLWKCEGLTDAMALAPHLPAGHVALTNSHGAKKFADENAPAFAGKTTFVVHDQDKAGKRGRKVVADALAGVEPRPRVVQLKLPYPMRESNGNDVRDWIADIGAERARESIARTVARFARKAGAE